MSPNELRRGSYQVQNQQSVFPWSRWQVATRVADGQAGFLIQIANQDLSADLRSKLATQLRVSGAQLQPLEFEAIGEQLIVFASVPTGRCLADQLKAGFVLSPSQVCELGIAIAQSLAQMHACSIVHGAVRMDRVWIAKNGQVMLLRDPATMAENQGRPADTDWLQSCESPQEYAAPEFADANHPADAATDVYSLGCLLFRLLIGRPAVESDLWDQAILLHGKTSPPETVSAVRQKESGDPLLRVIAYAMAKQRAVRFSSAGKLSAALQAVLPRVSEKVPAAPVPSSAVPPVLERSVGESSTRRIGRRKSKSPQKVIAVAGLSAACLLLLIGFVVLRSGVSATDDQPRPASSKVMTETVSNVPSRTAASLPPDTNRSEQPSSGYRVIADDQLLYVPPFHADSASISLELLPPGPAAIVSLRPAFLRSGPDGETLAAAFSNEVSGMLDALSARSGISVESIERCTIAIHPGNQGTTETSMAVHVGSPMSLKTLVQKLRVSASRSSEGSTIYSGDAVDGDAYFFLGSGSDDSTVSHFAIGPVERITEVANLDGAAILLPRQLQSLWNHASEETDFAALATANFLFADGRMLLQSTIPEAFDTFKDFLIPDVSAGLLLARFEQDRMYAEVRLSPSGGTSDARLMLQLSDAAAKLPVWADQFVIESQPDPSWRLLATRLPLMVRFAASHAKFGTSEGAAVGNMYLPQRVVPQLSVALSLALNTPRRRTISNPIAGTSGTLTIDQILDRKMSVSFDQESLEFAIDTITREFQQGLPEGTKMPAVRIIGADLQKMGITQNQQIRGFVKTDVALRTVLTDLVIQANPDRTATGPTDAKQTLIWVVADDPQQPGDQAILVTTRAAAEGKYQLPQEFVVPQ